MEPGKNDMASNPKVEEANVQAAHLEHANLQGANLKEANLQGANLLGTHLQGANLMGAYLQGAPLQDTHLQGTNLMGAHLEKANFLGAHLQGADLWGAYLQGADLSRSQGLTQEQIEEANGDENTKLPEGLQLPASWSWLSESQYEEWNEKHYASRKTSMRVGWAAPADAVGKTPLCEVRSVLTLAKRGKGTVKQLCRRCGQEKQRGNERAP